MKVLNDMSRGRPKLNLHLGCGSIRLPDYVNVDFFDDKGPDSSRGNKPLQADILLDITRLDDHVEPDSVDRVLMVHVLEHFTRWTGVRLLASIHRALKPGGTLEMEHPDLDGCIAFYLQSPRQMKTPIGALNIGFTQFYGNQWDELDYETHRYVWTKREMKQVAEGLGYSVLELNNQARYHVAGRDMRVVLTKTELPFSS
jgi:SAM-dependent methyltransferase